MTIPSSNINLSKCQLTRNTGGTKLSKYVRFFIKENSLASRLLCLWLKTEFIIFDKTPHKIKYFTHKYLSFENNKDLYSYFAFLNVLCNVNYIN